MSVEVRLPTLLRPAADGQSSVSLEGATVGEVLQALVSSHPGLVGQVLTDDGTLIANTATSPALAKLRDYLRDWESADRLAITDLAVMTETKNEGLAVRLVPASR